MCWSIMGGLLAAVTTWSMRPAAVCNCRVMLVVMPILKWRSDMKQGRIVEVAASGRLQLLASAFLWYALSGISYQVSAGPRSSVGGSESRVHLSAACVFVVSLQKRSH
ncbi:hypothetical protein N658DRAFT_210582 [Parathielavia hyrcaniae]|uniref:Uncharacterized protein n=1 Tax=Parathielavia hyrcaniae TaxID=113614 RepID=A0AAN6Q0J0_9PEZI|nr:hypothetical protein N658DRAFT_210582 [Parathielavia hyrcaniae]